MRVKSQKLRLRLLRRKLMRLKSQKLRLRLLRRNLMRLKSQKVDFGFKFKLTSASGNTPSQS